MPELIQEYKNQVQSSDGVSFTALAYGDLRSDGNWEGWLEFHSRKGIDPILRTGRETTQPDKNALAYWASGLELAYLEGALERATRAERREA